MGSLNAVRLFALALWAAAACGFGEVTRQPQPQLAAPFPEPPPAPVKLVSVLKPAGPEFLTGACPPLKAPKAKAAPILTDLYYRVPNPEYFKDQTEPGDLVTHVHELTHGVSNRLHATSKAHGIYLLEGRGIVIKHPKVTIEQVANAVPDSQRGKIFDLYLVKQRKDWNSSSAYLLDEWNAYIHGAIARRQLGLQARKETEDFAREMERYCRILVQQVKRLDPSYPDMDKLVDFVEWQSDRFNKIVSQ
jgi:hypothetical protein